MATTSEELWEMVRVLLESQREMYRQLKELGKRLFGILAAADLSAAMRERILWEGLYVARIHDNVFAMDTPEDFQPKVY